LICTYASICNARTCGRKFKIYEYYVNEEGSFEISFANGYVPISFTPQKSGLRQKCIILIKISITITAKNSDTVAKTAIEMITEKICMKEQKFYIHILTPANMSTYITS
jgi:hypothetical protein